MREISVEENRVAGEIVDAAIYVHRVLGPGLLEKIYEECLCYVLAKKGLKFVRQKDLPIRFEDICLDAGCRIDLFVEGKVIVELKATEKSLPLHEAQLYTYLKLSKAPLGLLMNFNVKLMKDGIKRMVMTQ